LFTYPYMRRDLDISLIRAFLAVVDADGVTAAASALGVSQAAASQQIKRLEEALDCRLFERKGRKLALAPAGERLLAQAQRLVTQSEELLSSMRRPEFEGEVRLGVCHTVDGNPSRTQSGAVKVRLDDEWRRAMGRRSRAIVTALTAPMLGWYGYLSSGNRARGAANGEARPGVLRSLDGGGAPSSQAEPTKESA